MASCTRFTRSVCLMKRQFHSSVKDTYPPDAPLRNKPKVSPPGDHELLPGITPKIFRETDYEVNLGPIPATGNEAKEGDYKNPEYFSYHNYSFYDIGKAIGCAYRPQPSAFAKKEIVFCAPWQNEEPVSYDCPGSPQDKDPLEKYRSK